MFPSSSSTQADRKGGKRLRRNLHFLAKFQEIPSVSHVSKYYSFFLSPTSLVFFRSGSCSSSPLAHISHLVHL